MQVVGHIKDIWKWVIVKINLSKYAATEQPPISTLPKKQDGLKSDLEYAD